MVLAGVTNFERFFRAEAGLDVHKQDLKRYSGFISHKIDDLLLCAQATAKANGRDIIDPHDLPITKGLQECIHTFAKLDADIQLNALLERITPRPVLDLAIGDETEARLPALAGGVSVALARAFKLLRPTVRNPATEDWDRAFRIFDLLL